MQLVATSRLRRAVVLFACMQFTCLPKPCHCARADCDFVESYDEIVSVIVNEPVHVTKFKWCLAIPPRCPDDKQEFRTVKKNTTVSKMRTVKKCCNDQIQLYEYCVSKCTEDQCPNIQCLSGTDKCICKPGYTGYLCKQRCGVGYWGSNCEETCHKACPYCDHRNGCCKTTSAIKGHTTVVTGLTFCAQDSASRPTSRTNIGTEYKRGDEIGDGSRLKEWFIVRGSPELAVTGVENQTSTTTMVETRKLVTENRSATEELQADTTEETALPSSSLPKRRQNGGTYVQTVEVMTVYKYDELVKKLIWISAMTVVAIAVVFIIMFVVFFNCYSVSKIPNRPKSRQRHTSTTNKMHETCMTQNLNHIPPDRYTKNPGLRSSINNDLPLHPEIFCPVFSAPHYINAGPALYDSPQPLYEILC